MADGLNIPSGEDLLNTQQKTAASIPYENINVADNAIKGVMNTFMMAQQVGVKRQRLEQQLQMAYMKNDLDQAKFGMSMDNMQTRHAIEMARLAQTASHQSDMYDLASKGLELRDANYQLDKKTQDFNMDLKQQKVNAQSTFTNEVAKMTSDGVIPGHPDYPKRMAAASAAASGYLAPSEVNAVMKQVGTNQNAALDHMERSNLLQTKALGEEIGSSLFGSAKSTDLRPVVDYQKYPDQPPPKQSYMDYFMHKPYNPPPTGNKIIPTVSSSGKKGSIVVSTQKLADFNTRLKALHDQRVTIQNSRVNDPSLGVYSTPALSRKELAQRALYDTESDDREKARAREILAEP